jgi:acyl dehydratase
MKYFEDIAVGDVYPVGRHTFTAADIKAFAHRFDPQAFHVDEAAAEQSHFGGLVASGWHTAVAWMRLMVAYRRRMADAMRTRGEPVAAIGPALGFRDLKWLKAVYVGDTIEYKTEVIGKRLSGSRPASGLVSYHSTGVNQNGEVVLSFESTTFVARRRSPHEERVEDAPEAP